MASNLKLADASNSSQEWLPAVAPARLFVAAGFTLLVIVALTLLTRRLCGAFSGSIPFSGYACCLLLASVVSCSLKFAAEWPPHRLSSQSAWIVGGLLEFPLVVIAIALMPVNWTIGGVALTLVVLTLVGWFCVSAESVESTRRLLIEIVWPEIRSFLCPASPQRSSASPAGVRPMVARESLLSLAVESATEDVGTDEVEGELISQIERRTLESGVELLEGHLVAEFAAGSRQAVLHVPFSPPFTASPKVDCEVVDGAEVRIKVGAVFPYGTRLELKRNTTELPALDVAVQLYAELQ